MATCFTLLASFKVILLFAIFGVSMGGATTMMSSGLKMPKQVKAYIEDCGYTNVKDEIEHEAEDLYHFSGFSRFPLVEVLSGITRN